MKSVMRLIQLLFVVLVVVALIGFYNSANVMGDVSHLAQCASNHAQTLGTIASCIP
jgi:hypothetical protein